MSSVSKLMTPHHVQLPGRYHQLRKDDPTQHEVLNCKFLTATSQPIDAALCAAALGYTLHRFTLQDEISLVNYSGGNGSDGVHCARYMKLHFVNDASIKDVVRDAATVLASDGGDSYMTLTNIGFCTFSEDLNPTLMSDLQRQFDVFVAVCCNNPNDTACQLSYKTCALDDDIAVSIRDTFVLVLQQCSEKPELQLSRLALTSTIPEYVYRYNDAKADYPREKTVHECFDDLVGKFPERIALEDCEWNAMTYKELRNVTNQLAQLFTDGGVHHGEPIGLLISRSIPCMSSVIAVLKSGCSYVHLNTCLPNEVLKYQADLCPIAHFICDEDGARCLLMDSMFPEATEIDIQRFQGLRLFRVLQNCSEAYTPSDSGKSTNPEDDTPQPFMSPSSVAYTMFTSGTTGRPKGVDVSHQNIVNFAVNFNGIDHSRETGMLHAPLNFDASTMEIWTILLNGGKLVIAPPVRMSSEDIVNFIKEHQISQAFLTTGLFHVVIAHHCEALKDVRHIVVCGDVMVPEWARRAVANLPTTSIYNNYGPTEATVFCTVYKIPSSFSGCDIGFVPVGTPMKNATLYLLDASLNPVPFGMPGDLYIGGDGVGLGYKGSQSQAFQRAPQWMREQFGECGLIYKSGDNARCIPDPCEAGKMNMQFLGRVDTQTKIAGNRVEVKECESWILRHPLVKDACVIANGSRADNRRLEAYVVLTASTTIRDLRRFSAKHLPTYSVPTVWYSVDRILLNNNGKVAYKELPKLTELTPAIPFALEITKDGDHTLKFDSTEKNSIARIWSEELRICIEEITDNTDFFEVGGTSMLALHILARMLKEANLKVANPEIFHTHPVFSDFVEHVLSTDKADANVPAAVPSSIDGKKLSWQQQDFYAIDKVQFNTHAHKIFATVKFAISLDPTKLEKAINKEIDQHSSLHSLFCEENSKPIKVKSKMLCHIQLTKVKLHGHQWKDVIRMISANSDEVELNIKRGPVMSCALYERNDMNGCILHVVAHHIAVDDFALWMFIKNVLSSYECYGDREEQKEQLTVDAHDAFIHEQSKIPQAVLSQGHSYWQSKYDAIAGNPFKISDLALKGTASNFRLSSVNLHVSKECVKSISQKHGLSHVGVLLSAYYLALVDVTGCHDIAVASPFANRNANTLNIIGTMANRVLLRLSPKTKTVSTKGLLMMVKRELSKCMKYQHVPLLCPVPRVAFNYFSTEAQDLPLGGQAEYIPVFNSPSDHYLWMELVEGDANIGGNIQYNKNVLTNSLIVKLKERFYAHLSELNRNGTVTLPCEISNGDMTNRISDRFEIETALLEDKQVLNCHATVLTSNGETTWCVYVKSNIPYKEMQSRCLQRLQSLGYSSAVVTPVKDIPKDTDGNVDEAKLASCLTVDHKTCAQIRENLVQLYPTAEITVQCTGLRSESPLSSSPSLSSASVKLQEDHPVRTGHNENGSPVVQPSQHSIEKSVSERHASTEVSNGTTFSEHHTITEALVGTAKTYPTKGITFITQHTDPFLLSYKQLLEEALQVSAGLRRSNISHGDFVILHDDSTRQMLPVWWGAVFVGAVPVFVSTSRTYRQITGVTDKLHHVWTTLNQPTIVCTETCATNVLSLKSLYKSFNMKVISSEFLLSHDPLALEETHHADAEDLLFLQLSSGSTGTPKCIQERHTSVIQHILLSSETNGYSSDDCTLNWLAMDHVVPLLTFHLKDTYLGCQQHIVDRQIVLHEPIQWLVLMTTYKITRSWAPNFGYADVVRHVSQLEETSQVPCIDLSSIKSLINAGEMVTKRTVADFVETMVKYGLDQQAIQPSFGMAETATCFTYPLGVDYLGSLTWCGIYSNNCFVDLGPPMRNVNIRICDPTTGECMPDGEVGELEISGPVITRGYLFNDAANEKLFHGDFLRSGDSAFLRGGHLFLTGRIKEQITIRGNKLFCHEVEEAVGLIDGVKQTFVACCGVTSDQAGTEGMVAFLCVDGTLAVSDVTRDVKILVNKRFGVLPSEVVVLSETAFLKTTSGKIQRLAMKQLYESGSLKSVLPVESDRILQRVLEPAKLCRTSRPDRCVVLVVRADGHGLSSRVIKQLVRDGVKVCVVNVLTSSSKEDSFGDEVASFDVAQNDMLHFDPVLKMVLDYAGFVDYCVNFLCHTNSGMCNACNGEDLLSKGNGNLQLFTVLKSLVGVCRRPLKFINITCKREDPASTFSSVLLPIISSEHDTLHAVDVQISPEMSTVSGVPLEDIIIKEVFSVESDSVVIYQDGKRSVPRFEMHTPYSYQSASIKHGGTYIVSGGFGDTSLQLIHFLHSKYQAKIIVVGRRGMGDEDVSAAYQACVQKGVEVLYVSGDIACKDTFDNIMNELRSTWPSNSVDGAFHLANTYEEEEATCLTPDSINTVVRGKTVGAKMLFKFLKKTGNNTVLVLFSSVYAALPMRKLLTYSAANAFLNSFAEQTQNDERSNVHVVCYNWSLWKDMGVSKDHPVNERADHLGLQRIEASQGLTTMEEYLGTTTPLFVGLNPSGTLVKSNMVSNAHQDLSNAAIKVAISATSDSHLPVHAQVIKHFKEMSFVDGRGNPLKPENFVVELSVQSVETRAEKGHETSSLREKVLQEWCSVLGVSMDGLLSENFFEMGGESIDIPNLVARLRSALDRDLSMDDIYQYPTISELTEYLLKSSIQTPDDALTNRAIWLPTTAPAHPMKSPAKAILFCFPYIGSSYGCFSSWSFPEIDVWFTIYPHKPQNWNELVSMMTTGILEITLKSPNTPFVLYGHSFAALLVYEVYHELCRQGCRPSLVVVSGMHSPLRMDLRRPSVKQWNANVETDERFLKAMRKAGFEIDQVLMDRASINSASDDVIGQIRYLFKLYENYRTEYTRRKISVPLTVFGSKGDTFVTLEELRCWQEVCSDTISVESFPGGHFFLYYENGLVFAKLVNRIFDTLQI